MTVPIMISGGGLVGATMALALAHEGVRCVVIDREPIASLENPAIDGRTTAIALASQRFFEKLGVWALLKDYASPIQDIRVFEGSSPWVINFNHTDIGPDPMGYIVDNYRLRHALYQCLQAQGDRIQWIAPAQMTATSFLPHHVDIQLDCAGEIQQKQGSLLIIAEGRYSQTCQSMGIAYRHVDYHQKALVFSVFHEKSHQGVAWEVFYPDGPLAFLPLMDCPVTGRHRSGVVWTLPHGAHGDTTGGGMSLADHWFACSPIEIGEKLKELFPYFGEVELCGPKWSYPLWAQLAKKMIDSRVVIMGDAAHAYHPVAGQGVNVGWRDAAVLAEILGDAQRLGLDLGGMELLKTYQRHRHLDTLSILGMTDLMVRLFSNNSRVLYFLRNTGVGLVNQVSPLKRFFMKRAMGYGGNVPRFMRP